MKRQISITKRTGILTLLLSAATCAAFAQGPGGGDWGNGPDGNRPPPPPLPPVIRALDTNHDGIIEASEIDNAPQSLRTLLKSGSDSLSIPDLLGPPHHGHHPRLQGQGQGNRGGQGPDLQLANPGDQNSPPPPNGQGAPNTTGTSGTSGGDNPNGPPPGPPPGGLGGHRPLPPVIQALDTNHDRIIDSTEIANAAQSLKTLLKNGSDQLTIPDLLGPPPHGRRPGGRGNNNQDGPPGPPPGDNGQDGQAPPNPPGQGGTDAQSDSQQPPPPPPPQ